MRGTAGADYSKTFIAPGGIEVKPFGNARYDYDYFDIKPADRTERNDDANEFQDVSFGRTVGQIGVDVRYPFIKSSGGVDWIIEPRAQVTQSFGDGRLENFSSSDSGKVIKLRAMISGKKVHVRMSAHHLLQMLKARVHIYF